MLLVDRELSVFIYWISLQPTPTSVQKKEEISFLSPFKNVVLLLFYLQFVIVFLKYIQE